MNIIHDTITLSTRGFNDMQDITGEVSNRLSEHGLKNGTVTIFVSGSTGGLTTIEFESGLEKDFAELMDKIIPCARLAFGPFPYNPFCGWEDDPRHLAADCFYRF